MKIIIPFDPKCSAVIEWWSQFLDYEFAAKHSTDEYLSEWSKQHRDNCTQCSWYHDVHSPAEVIQ